MHTGINTKAFAKQRPTTNILCFDIVPRYVNTLKQWAKRQGISTIKPFKGDLIRPDKIITKLTGPITLGVLGEGVAGHLSGKELANYLIALKPHTANNGTHIVSIRPSNSLGNSHIWELPQTEALLTSKLYKQLEALGAKSKQAPAMAKGLVALVQQASRAAKQRGTQATHIGELKDTLQAAGYEVDILPYTKIGEPVRVDLKEPQLISTHKGPDLRLTGAKVINEKPIKQKDLAFLKITKAKKKTLKKAKKRNAT